LEIVGLLLHISNTKIVYKSGHVERYFFTKISYRSGHGGSKEIEWEAPILKRPVMANVDEIESIVKIW